MDIILAKNVFLSSYFRKKISYWDICIFYRLWYLFTTMSQDMLIQLKNKETGEVYFTRKNRKKVERKIELKKYSKKLRKRVVFKEAKK